MFSKIGSITFRTAVCTTRSSTAGMPSGLSSLLPSLGIQTRLTGWGIYCPFLSMSCTCSSRWGLSRRYCSAFWPSTPAAPLFCTTLLRALCRFSILHALSIKLNHLPPLIPLWRVSNMRSVHTLASVHSHFWGTSLPCLAIGTPGSLNCVCVSFTRPPSCPPWLHGHYPFLCYYGDSDSCPAPSSARTGLLDYPTRISGHSVSSHPMRPLPPAMLLVPGGLGPRFALGRYRRFFGLRSLLAVSSVA